MEDELIGLIDTQNFLVGYIPSNSYIPGPQGPAGAGIQKMGYAFIQDNLHTLLAPFVVGENQRVKLPNNGLGALSSLDNVPDGSFWYDPADNKFHGDAPSDFFYYRVNLTLIPQVNNKTFSIDFDIGTQNLPFVQTVTLSRGAGVPTKCSFVIPIAVGNAMMNNGGTLNIWSESPVEIYGINVLIHKAFAV